MSFISYFNPASKSHHASEEFKDLTTGQKAVTGLATAGGLAVAIPIAIIAGPIAGAIALPFVASSSIATFRALTNKFTSKVNPQQKVDTQEDKPTVKINNTAIEVITNKSVIEEKQPVIEEKQPVIEEKQPVIEENQPIIEEKQPVIEEKQPVIEEKQPAEQKPVIVEEKIIEKQPAEQKPVVLEKPVEVILEKQPILKQTLKNKKQPKSLNDILLSVALLIKKGNPLSEFSKIFYSELSKMMNGQSNNKNLDIIFTLIQNNDEVESRLNKIIIGEHQTLNGKIDKFLNEKEIAKLQKNLFGLDLQEFLVNSAPLENLECLNDFIRLIENSYMLTHKEQIAIKSSILCQLHKKILKDYKISANNLSPSFKNLISNIKFIENESKEGVKIVKSNLIDNTLSVDYETDDEASFEEVSIEEAKDENEETNYHPESIDYLKKLAAYYRINEFNPKKFEISTFKEMLVQAKLLLNEIDKDHELFPFFYNICAKIIDRYTRNFQVFDIIDLNKVKGSYNELFTKLGHEELVIDLFTENDTELAESEYKKGFDDLVNNYIALGVSREQAELMAAKDMGV